MTGFETKPEDYKHEQDSNNAIDNIVLSQVLCSI